MHSTPSEHLMEHLLTVLASVSVSDADRLRHGLPVSAGGAQQADADAVALRLQDNLAGLKVRSVCCLPERLGAATFVAGLTLTDLDLVRLRRRLGWSNEGSGGDMHAVVTSFLSMAWAEVAGVQVSGIRVGDEMVPAFVDKPYQDLQQSARELNRQSVLKVLGEEGVFQVELELIEARWRLRQGDLTFSAPLGDRPVSFIEVSGGTCRYRSLSLRQATEEVFAGELPDLGVDGSPVRLLVANGQFQVSRELAAEASSYLERARG